MAEALTVFHWGRASDHLGRRPVLLLGPLGLAFAMIGFGLSTHFWSLVIYRCMQGIFNGNIGKRASDYTDPRFSLNSTGVSKTILAEVGARDILCKV